MASKANMDQIWEPGLEGPIARLAQRQAELRAQLVLCVDALGSLEAGTVTMQRASVSPAGPQRGVQDLQSEIRYLQSRLDLLEGRCAAVTELAAIITARIDEILRSRIWRTLALVGRLLLKIAGK
jgi:hypothetical protein